MHKKDVAEVTFHRFFKHYRNGKVYDAHAYGHKSWPIGKRKQQ